MFCSIIFSHCPHYLLMYHILSKLKAKHWLKFDNSISKGNKMGPSHQKETEWFLDLEKFGLDPLSYRWEKKTSRLGSTEFFKKFNSTRYPQFSKFETGSTLFKTGSIPEIINFELFSMILSHDRKTKTCFFVISQNFAYYIKVCLYIAVNH